MSGYKGKRKTDISRWRATKYATMGYYKAKPRFGVLAYIKAPHWEYGGVFGGVPPGYVRFDPPLKS